MAAIKILDNAINTPERMSEGKEKYNLLVNNCSQIIVSCIENRTGIDIKDGCSPIHNDKFKNINKSLSDE